MTIDGGIRLRDDDSYLLPTNKMYQYVSVLRFSHTCGISFEKSINVLSKN